MALKHVDDNVLGLHSKGIQELTLPLWIKNVGMNWPTLLGILDFQTLPVLGCDKVRNCNVKRFHNMFLCGLAEFTFVGLILAFVAVGSDVALLTFDLSVLSCPVCPAYATWSQATNVYRYKNHAFWSFCFCRFMAKSLCDYDILTWISPQNRLHLVIKFTLLQQLIYSLKCHDFL